MQSARPLRTERRLAQAVRIAMLSLAMAGAAGASQPVFAAGVSLDSAATKNYQLSAGPLGRALSSFAAQSGIALSFDPQLAQGLDAPALSGTYSAREALDRLLSGSGLEIVAREDGSYTLRKQPDAAPRDSATLPMVQVVSDMGATTEGTGSYTTGSASTATKLNLSLRETPQSVSVITRQRMEDQGLTQLSDVVVQTPGLTLSGGGNIGSDSSPIYARGFQVDNYQIDGVSQLYSNYGDIFQTNDMALYDHVEVVRGATGLMTGIGLPGATINLIRKRPTRTFQASARVEAGSWDYYRAEADVSTPMNEAGTLRGRLTTAYQQNDSYIDRLEEKKKIVSGIVEADIAPNTLATIGFTYQDQEATGHARAGLPKFFSDGSLTNWSRSKSAAANWASSDRENQTLFASLEHRFDNEWLAKGTYTYSKSKYNEILGYAAAYRVTQWPDRTTGGNLDLWASRWAGEPEQNSLDLYATGPFSLFGRKHELVVGMTSTYTKDDTVGYDGWHNPAIPNIYNWDGNTPAQPVFAEASDIVMREHTNSAYTTARFKPADDLSVILGARYTSWEVDNRTDYYDPAETDSVDNRKEHKVIPYAGIVYDINDNWSTYASYTDIFKPQNARDINDRFIDPLQGKSYEIGAKGEFFNKRLNVAAALYKVKQDNLAVAIDPPVPVTGGNAVEAMSGTETRGFEVEVGGEIMRNWQASASFSRNLTKDREDKPLNTNVPQNTFKLFTTYRIAGIGNGLTVGGGVRWQGDTYSDEQGPNSVRLKQKAYSVVDLVARYDISKNLSATFNVYNAFDKSYYLTSDTNSYYGAPRNVRVGLDMRF